MVMVSVLKAKILTILVYYLQWPITKAASQLNCTQNDALSPNGNVLASSLLPSTTTTKTSTFNSNQSKIACPMNSQCRQVSFEVFQCICKDNFELNPKWEEQHTANIKNNNNDGQQQLELLPLGSLYCLNTTTTTTSTTTITTTLENNLNNSTMKIYIRTRPKIEHLAFSILMVLLVTILAVAFIYFIKVLRPIKRTKYVYTKLKRRHENRRRLSEQHDDISMIALNET